MRYIVAIDGSDESDDAVRYAATHSIAMDATLDIVHVLAPRAELIDGELIFPGSDKAMEGGQQTLEAAKQLATSVADGSESLTIETQLLSGRPSDAITEYAEESESDAIYVGHRGLSEKKEQVTGSVAKRVVDRATVPVTVIR